MNRTVTSILFGIFLIISGSAHAQTDPPVKKKALPVRQKLIPNTTRLELVYREALVTQYNTNGGSRSYNVFTPYVRINGAKPVEIGKHADFLRTFFSKCNVADQQLDLMNQQNRRAKLDFIAGMGVGIPVAVSSVFAAGNNGNSTAFFTRFFLGAAIMTTGAYLAHWHATRADEHLRLSVDLYNSRCFKPLPADTAHPQPAQASADRSPTRASERKIYEDTTLFRLVRNEPSASGLFGLTVIPLVANVSSLNINFNGGLSLFYTYESRLGVSLTYTRAYLDDLKGNSRNEIPSGDAESYGIPANYTKSSILDLQTKITTLSWEKEGYYHLKLGNTRVGGRAAEVYGRTKAKVLTAITARMGYQLDNRLVESSTGGIPYVNATPAYEYKYQGQTYPMTPTNLQTSSTMVKAGVITAGLGYSSYRDIKIELVDDTYKGRREEKSQTDLYVDLLYAQSMKVRDMIYYTALEPITGEYMHLPQRLDVSNTPVNKIGVRLGYQAIVMYKPNFGWKTMMELGIRPGPKTFDKQEGFYLQLGFGLLFGGRHSQQ